MGNDGVKRNTSSTESAETKQPKFPIVGVGASAGGLEAFTAFLKGLPPDLGMAYVFLPHLDRSRASALVQILTRATSLPVKEATEGTAVEPNQVYVIPRNCDMTIREGVLHLAERDRPTVNVTIDGFLRSLAADQGSNAIGVILSGTANDGTLGLAEIKREGGITFAQDETARYDGMPASAIAAGCVDRVLPPEGIAKELTRIARHPYVLGLQNELEPVGKNRPAQMAQIFALLRRATRVDFSEYKPPTISRRVLRRMALHKIEHLNEYVVLLQRDRKEVMALYQDLLINVTSFFRDAEAFETLKSVVYPELVKQHANSSVPIRIWVPGCSTGEETYSHAISLLEFLTEERLEWPVQIFGTDLSEAAIQRARAGIYKDNIAADVSPVRLRRFFHQVDSGYQVSKAVRDLCIFSTQNVFSDPPFSRLDLVSCRNVMIYLGHTLQRRVVPIFHYALNPSGFLMIGNTEGLVGSGSELFDVADRKQKIYRKKAVPTPVTFGFSVHTAEPHINGSAIPAHRPPEAARIPADVQREADRLLLTRYAPPAVVVNEDLEIVHTKGHTGTFLELPSGRASLNLLKMARPGLLHELQDAIEQAKKTGETAIRTNVPVGNFDAVTITTLRVTPFKLPVQEQYNFLIVFEAAAQVPQPQAEAAPVSPLSDDERTLKDKQIEQLRQELAATKEYLQSIIEALESANEELQSANEEIQSGNEELQSTNEELQTSKEELESANEELHTVNEEMQHRNELLSQLNNDLQNLLNSVNLPMVMVGPDLSVRRFTPQAAKRLGIGAGDIGRPITRLKLNLELPGFEQMLLDVMSEVRPAQHRVRDDRGEYCEVRLTPYRTSDNRIDGVVLSMLSLDERNGGGARPKAKRKPGAKGRAKAMKR